MIPDVETILIHIHLHWSTAAWRNHQIIYVIFNLIFVGKLLKKVCKIKKCCVTRRTLTIYLRNIYFYLNIYTEVTSIYYVFHISQYSIINLIYISTYIIHPSTYPIYIYINFICSTMVQEIFTKNCHHNCFCEYLEKHDVEKHC